MQRHVASVDAYLKLVPAGQLSIVEQLRKLVFASSKKLTERIEYGMLGFCDDQGPLYCVAAQKNYVCLYVATHAVAEMADELTEIDHGKCCLRFKRLEQIPVSTIRKLLKLGAKRIADDPCGTKSREKKKSAPQKSTANQPKSRSASKKSKPPAKRS